MDSTVKTGREFQRVSYDRSGRERSNDEQHADNERAWPGLKWGKPYRETGSASRYATKPRDDWPRLIADLEADQFDDDLLVMWENSRGSRKVSEWCQLIELCELRSVKIGVTTHNRIYDCANGRDRRSLIDDANDAEFESYKTSARITRSVVANAEAGRPIGGRVPFGYKRIHDERTGRYVSQEIEPTEAEIIVEVYERIAKGHALRSITRDFAARGIINREGRPFAHATLRVHLRNPCYIAKRVYVPGRSNDNTTPETMRHPNALVTEAAWPAIVPESLWWQVQAILEDPSRGRPGGGSHLLGMIAACDACSGPLAAKYRAAGRRYQCQRTGCVMVDADQLDELAEKVMLAYLARPDVYESLAAGGDDDQALEDVRAEVARVRAERDDLYEQGSSGRLSPTAVARMEPGILARLREAELREQELSTPPVLRGLIEPGDDVAVRWETAEMSTKREVARLLLSPDMLGELRVTPAGKGGNARIPAHERVVWRRHG